MTWASPHLGKLAEGTANDSLPTDPLENFVDGLAVVLSNGKTLYLLGSRVLTSNYRVYRVDEELSISCKTSLLLR